MPLPKPHSGEEHDKYISRFMADSTASSDYPDQKQRYAVAQSEWKTHISKSFEVAKRDDSQQLVFGWANVAFRTNGEQVLDFQKDLVDTEELESAAYLFNLIYRDTGEMHKGESVGKLVESFVVTKEKLASMGLPEDALPQGWWVGFHIPDSEVFAKVKEGKYKMLSIQGSARREPTGDE